MFIEYQELSSSMLGALSIKRVSWDLCPLRVSSMIRENFFIHVIEIAHICIAPCNCNILYTHLPGGSDGKESACNAGDPGSIPLEKEMATHSSTRAWRTHGQKSLAGYNSWGLKDSDTTK